MDEYQRHQRGRRDGRVCPCCGDRGTKHQQNKATRARFAEEIRHIIAAEAPGDHR